jgi:hypothetical protein
LYNENKQNNMQQSIGAKTSRAAGKKRGAGSNRLCHIQKNEASCFFPSAGEEKQAKKAGEMNGAMVGGRVRRRRRAAADVVIHQLQPPSSTTVQLHSRL